MRKVQPLTAAEYRLAVERERARHTRAMKRLDERLAECQRTCPHTVTSFVPDPSGNRDSYYECVHCDAHV